MGLRQDSERLTVGTMLRGEESWITNIETDRESACVRTRLIAGFAAGELARLQWNGAEVLLARKLPGWNQKRRPGEVESEAVATPIIKGTLVIESEETV